MLDRSNDDPVIFFIFVGGGVVLYSYVVRLPYVSMVVSNGFITYSLIEDTCTDIVPFH